MKVILKKGQKLLALDEEQVYRIEDDVTTDSISKSNVFDFLARNNNGVVRGFLLKNENITFSLIITEENGTCEGQPPVDANKFFQGGKVIEI